MDKESLENINRIKDIADTVSSKGWAYITDDLHNKLKDSISVFNVSGDTPEKVMLDLEARKLAVNLVSDWLEDIMGEAINAEYIKEENNKNYITRF